MKAQLPTLLPHEPVSPTDARVLLITARALRHATDSGGGPVLLKGKNIALICDRPDCDCATTFDDAATALGARVSRIHAQAAMSPDEARLLGHLYDAIDCEHMPPAFAQQLRRHLTVPVYEGLGHADHPVMRLLEPGSTDEDRLFLRQALLINTIG